MYESLQFNWKLTEAPPKRRRLPDRLAKRLRDRQVAGASHRRVFGRRESRRLRRQSHRPPSRRPVADPVRGQPRLSSAALIHGVPSDSAALSNNLSAVVAHPNVVEALPSNSSSEVAGRSDSCCTTDSGRRLPVGAKASGGPACQPVRPPGWHAGLGTWACPWMVTAWAETCHSTPIQIFDNEEIHRIDVDEDLKSGHWPQEIANRIDSKYAA